VKTAAGNGCEETTTWEKDTNKLVRLELIIWEVQNYQEMAE
jgi:hypothetical protein